MTAPSALDRLAAAVDFHRMGEASALARYSDLDTATPEAAFRRGHDDGAAAGLAEFPAVVLGLSDQVGYVQRLCDPDAVPGTARPAEAGPQWAALPGFAPDSLVGRALFYQGLTYAPDAAGLAPLDAYVLGFKRGVRAAAYAIRNVAASMYDLADVLAHAPEPSTGPS